MLSMSGKQSFFLSGKEIGKDCDVTKRLQSNLTFDGRLFHTNSYFTNYSLSREVMWMNLQKKEAITFSRLNLNCIFPKITKI